MEAPSAATPDADRDAVEFVRFCYRRRRVGWPELYDEMCAVANRGHYRGYGTEDLAGLGIGFGLFDMPALAVLSRRVIAEEQTLRRPVAVMISPVTDEPVVDEPETDPEAVLEAAAPVPAEEAAPVSPAPTGSDEHPIPSVRLLPVVAGA